MTPVQKEKILSTIVNQLNISKNVEKSLSKVIFSAHLISYQNIKLLCKSIKSHLDSYDINSKQTQLLNMISKALGYQNHHSLKAHLEPATNQLSVEKEDSQFMKFYKINKAFINKFKFDEYHITHYIHKSFEFEVLYQKYGTNSRTKAGREITSYLKDYGIKPYKNTVPLFKIKFQDLQRVAFNIIKNYQNFFTPVWIETSINLKNYSPILDDWIIVAYSDVSYSTSDFIVVDLYSTDLPWNIIINFIDYVFKFGTLEDVYFMEQCLKNKEFTKTTREITDLEEVARLNTWQKDKLTHNIDISFEANGLIKSLDVKNHQVVVRDYMLSIIKKIELTTSKKLHEIIIQNCITQFNKKQKYTIEIIYEDIANQFNLKKLNEKEYETIMRIAYEVYLILECLKNEN